MNDSVSAIIASQTQAARQAFREVAILATETKNEALRAMAAALEAHSGKILAANSKDLAFHRGLSRAMQKRLTLSRESILRMAQGLRTVADLEDPVGKIERVTTSPNGLILGRLRVPIGVIAIIFESRPNVIVDVSAIMLKSGNCCVLRGGKEALETNKALAALMRKAAVAHGVPPDYLQFVEHTDHEIVKMLSENAEHIDLMIPRGGSALMETVHRYARMPVRAHDRGVCHIYIEESANLKNAVRIAVNAKVNNPSTCNAAETILIDETAAPTILPPLIEELRRNGVEVRGCEKTRAIVPDVQEATNEDWDMEYLDLIVSIKVVSSFDEAVAHITRHSTGVAEAIVTENYTFARRFLRAVESAAVYVNASTRLTDGAEFGLGAEVGISTAKTYNRGPMGIEELTVTKYIAIGQGQVRGS